MTTSGDEIGHVAEAGTAEADVAEAVLSKLVLSRIKLEDFIIRAENLGIHYFHFFHNNYISWCRLKWQNMLSL